MINLKLGKLILREDKERMKITLDDLLFITKRSSGLLFQLKDANKVDYTTETNLNEINELLANNPNFVRLKNYLINIDLVNKIILKDNESYKDYSLTLACENAHTLTFVCMSSAEAREYHKKCVTAKTLREKNINTEKESNNTSVGL